MEGITKTSNGEHSLNFDLPKNEDAQQEIAPDTNKDFLSGVEKTSIVTLDDEIESLRVPKQDYSSDIDMDNDEGFESELDDFMDEKPKTNKNAKKNASLIVMWFDNVIAWVLAWWSGNMDDFTTFQAEKKNLKIINKTNKK